MELKNCRQAYGETLRDLGSTDPNIVVLEADLGKSTMSEMFRQAYSDRYFQVGIAEQNMTSVAAGLALTGKTAFTNSFAVFSTGRAYDQIRSSVAIPRLNVKICGSSAGLSDYGDGKTHQSIDDIALMRVLPGMTVLSPLDAVETAQMVREMARIPGPCYIRLNRNDLPVYVDPGDEYHIGKLRMLRDGSDVVVFASGVMVTKALQAAELLQSEGVSARVVSVSTIKPLDASALMAYCRGVKAVVTSEEHNVHGGLGSAICEALSLQRLPIAIHGIEDSFGYSAENYDVLLEKYNLTPQGVARKVREALSAI
jgi:transketolase